VAAGGGLLEDQVRAAIEPGLGWIFEVGNVGIGPFGRYIQIIETEDQFDGNDARLALLGVEAVLFDERDRPMRPAARTISARDRGAAAPAARQPAPAPQEPRAREMEPERTTEAASERVLDVRVLFDYDKSELRPEGKESLREVASSFMEEGQSGRILRVQGYADQRGSVRYNLHLGTERALAVRNYLISLGVPADQIRTEAYGEDWPAVPDANESSEFQQNRRATFVIVLGDPTVAQRTLRPAQQVEAEEGRPGMEETQPVRGEESDEPAVEPVPGRERTPDTSK
jgi:peptidoglycan-associated lipoprotein